MCFPESLQGVSSNIDECFEGDSKMFQESFKSTLKKLWKFQECVKDV